MKVPSNPELMHMRLQAWLREYKCDDIEYLGERDGEHYYRIADNEVSVSNIEDLELVDE
jgi:hypothetical protein